jgi:hypothetical protein
VAKAVVTPADHWPACQASNPDDLANDQVVTREN